MADTDEEAATTAATSAARKGTDRTQAEEMALLAAKEKRQPVYASPAGTRLGWCGKCSTNTHHRQDLGCRKTRTFEGFRRGLLDSKSCHTQRKPLMVQKTDGKGMMNPGN
ncbi:MAG: hypothetical protein AB1351_03040 [Thermoproteota archaeon]